MAGWFSVFVVRFLAILAFCLGRATVVTINAVLAIIALHDIFALAEFNRNFTLIANTVVRVFQAVNVF